MTDLDDVAPRDRWRPPEGVDALRIDRELPQTQCTRCGFPSCRAYAEALAEGTTELNRCPPGGSATILALAELLKRPALPLDPACGVEAAWRVALIDEANCIGCTKCIQACPVDAIIGSAKWMHTVIAADCTGCEICLAPCPVDCIEMVASDQPQSPWLPARERAEVHNARALYEIRLKREREARELAARRDAERQKEQERLRARALLQAALERRRSALKG